MRFFNNRGSVVVFVQCCVYFAVTEYTGEFLVLHRVRRKDMGAFLCIAKNDVPPTVSKRIMLNVNCKLFNYLLFQNSIQILIWHHQFLQMSVWKINSLVLQLEKQSVCDAWLRLIRQPLLIG